MNCLIHWGLWALVFSADMTIFWVKYIKLRRKRELVMAIIYTIFTRTELKLSQNQLAEMVGVSRNTISSIETGQFNPTAKLALILCIALDKKFEELFYFD